MISWLASYPKSGNTWVRVLLDAYLKDAEPDINDLDGSRADHSEAMHNVARKVTFADLPEDQQLLTRPMALLRYDQLVDGGKSDDMEYPLILKTHQGNFTVSKVRLIPPQLTAKTVYIVRDPRDVAVSYAKHFGLDIDGAITALTHKGVVIRDIERELGKTPQYIASWNRHVSSYARADGLDVTIIKYEQLKSDTVKYFTWILNWYEIPVDAARVKRAVAVSTLSRLRKQEAESKFKEKSPHTDVFFGKGEVRGWERVLSSAQVEKIEENAGDMMREFGYLNEEKVAA